MKKFVAKDHIAALNIFKRGLNGVEFSEQDLIQGLKECGIPSNGVFRRELKKTSILQVVTKDRYVFASKEPIYFGVLDRVYQGYHARVTRYNNAYKSKKKLKEVA